MIITISGMPGSGKSTAAKEVAKKLKLKHYSNGDFMRDIAKKRGITLIELSKIAEKSDEIDKELDERQTKLGKTKDNFVIDSRLGFYFIPNSVKIFLNADIEVRAKRIFGDKRIEESAKSMKDMIKEMKDREASERKRYKEYYSIDHLDMNNYDFVLDTTKLRIEEMLEKVLGFVEKKTI